MSLDFVPLTWATPHIYSGRLFDKVSLSANKSLNSRNLSTPTFVTIMLSTGCIPRMMIRRFAHKAIDNATAHSLISILFEKLLVVMTNKKWKSSQCLKITQNSHFYQYQRERSEQVFFIKFNYLTHYCEIYITDFQTL